jgi:hypothetical protein
VAGHHRPPAYCHMIHSDIAIATTAHGTAGLVLRFATSKVAHRPCAKVVRTRASIPTATTRTALPTVKPSAVSTTLGVTATVHARMSITR